MRYGFTTGSCAAAAAKAAAYMLLTGREKHEITITTPKGILYHARMEEISRTEHSVRCAVRKDGGDDPDITNGNTDFCGSILAGAETGKRLRKTADSYYGRHGCRNCHKAGVRPARRERGDQSCAAGDDYPRGGRSVCAYRLCGEPFGGDFGAGGRGTCPKDVQPETRYCGRYLNPWNDRDCGAHEQSGAP